MTKNCGKIAGAASACGVSDAEVTKFARWVAQEIRRRRLEKEDHEAVDRLYRETAAAEGIPEARLTVRLACSAFSVGNPRHSPILRPRAISGHSRPTQAPHESIAQLAAARVRALSRDRRLAIDEKAFTVVQFRDGRAVRAHTYPHRAQALRVAGLTR